MKNGGKIAVTISHMQSLKALHHAARKVKVCNIFHDVFQTCYILGFGKNRSVTSLMGFYIFYWIALAKC